MTKLDEAPTAQLVLTREIAEGMLLDLEEDAVDFGVSLITEESDVIERHGENFNTSCQRVRWLIDALMGSRKQVVVKL